jgi:molecular chaperone GrpE
MKKKKDTKSEIAKLEEQLKEYKKKAETNLEGWKRAKADYINLKKRVESSNQAAVKYANESLILSLLPILDNFQSAYSTLSKDIEDNNWVKGIGYIKNQLELFLKDNNVEKIEVVGKKFDPEFHEAVESVKSSEGEGTIIEEILKGYKMKDRVIRPAKVKVAR